MYLMPIVPRNLHHKCELKTKELFIGFHFGCHDQVAIAMRYVADAYCPKEPPSVNSIRLKTKELLRFHCDYHGN